jgi:hypothetical protein
MAAADGRCVLVSFVTGPIVVTRDNTYVLMVTDAALASVAQSFQWTFKENGTVKRSDTTDSGEIVYQPSTIGTLAVSVSALDASNTQQANISLEQQVVPPSAELEALISQAQNTPGPGVADPEIARELINEHSNYYQQVALQQPEAGDSFKRFVFSMVSSGATRHPPADRRQHLEDLATAVNDQPAAFAQLATTGAGVCNIRLLLLAMVLPQTPGGAPFLPWQEMPDVNPQHASADEQLRQSLTALSEDSLIDLFNIVRFPKTNIAMCGRILESLRDRYFSGTNFNDVLTGMSGTRADWIVRNFLEGPLTRQ